MNRHHRRKIAALDRAEIKRRVLNPVAPDPGSKYFTCTLCRGRFEKNRESWSEEHARAELARAHGAVPEQQIATLCQDCYEIVQESMRAN